MRISFFRFNGDFSQCPGAMLWSFVVFVFSGCVGSHKHQEAHKKYPNIIVILADDLGFSDIGCYGGEIQTPHLDSLAESGTVFSHFYTTSKCSPSRASLLTGMYPHRAGIGKNISQLGEALKTGPYQGYLNDETLTIAEHLKPLGYATAMVGKWHVGENPQHWPKKRGFDHYFGLISGASSYYEIIENQKRTRQMVKDDTLWNPPKRGFYMTDAFTEEALDFMNKQGSEPYLLYVAYTAPHWPLHAPEQLINSYHGYYVDGWEKIREERFSRQKEIGLVSLDSELPPLPDHITSWSQISDKATWSRRMQVYAAMVHSMDQGIGRILNSVRDPENTVVIFASDNGASHEDVSDRGLHDASKQIGEQGSYDSYQEPWALVSNTPLRKHKLFPYEGGIASPCIISYPKITGNCRISHFPGHLMDVLPSILGLIKARSDAANSNVFDGVNLFEILEKEVNQRNSPIFFEYSGRKAVIQENWKLVSVEDGNWSLFNLENDRVEQRDVIDEFPQLADSLKLLYQDWANKVGAE